jgi:hypothetical protein
VISFSARLQIQVDTYVKDAGLALVITSFMSGAKCQTPSLSFQLVFVLKLFSYHNFNSNCKIPLIRMIRQAESAAVQLSRMCAAQRRNAV